MQPRPAQPLTRGPPDREGGREDCGVPATLHRLGPGAAQNVNRIAADGQQEGVYRPRALS